MKYFKSLIFLTTLSLVSSYAVSTTLENTDAEAINSEWISNFDKGNTAALMKLYTDNAIMFPPSSEILKGQTEILNYFEALQKVGVTEYSISNVALDIKGETAYETAIWEATRIDTNGTVFNFEGNITNVLEKQKDGSWKIKLQSWN